MTAGATNESVRFLADENFEPAIVEGLRRQQPRVDILTANEAGTLGMQDPDLLAFATAFRGISFRGSRQPRRDAYFPQALHRPVN